MALAGPVELVTSVGSRQQHGEQRAPRPKEVDTSARRKVGHRPVLHHPAGSMGGRGRRDVAEEAASRAASSSLEYLHPSRESIAEAKRPVGQWWGVLIC